MTGSWDTAAFLWPALLIQCSQTPSQDKVKRQPKYFILQRDGQERRMHTRHSCCCFTGMVYPMLLLWIGPMRRSRGNSDGSCARLEATSSKQIVTRPNQMQQKILSGTWSEALGAKWPGMGHQRGYGMTYRLGKPMSDHKPHKTSSHWKEKSQIKLWRARILKYLHLQNMPGMSGWSSGTLVKFSQTQKNGLTGTLGLQLILDLWCSARFKRSMVR
jgi:hypothetical protein